MFPKEKNKTFLGNSDPITSKAKTTYVYSPKCTYRGIPDAIRDRIIRPNRYSAGLKTDSERIAMIESLKDMHPDGDINLTHLCYRYLRALAAYCGL